MTYFDLRIPACVFLLSLLSACGGTDPQPQEPVQGTAAPRTEQVAEQQIFQNPVPDCQPENCEGLRIIDGNAEAYRADRMRRAAAEAGGASQS
jgi:hypothetical protein